MKRKVYYTLMEGGIWFEWPDGVPPPGEADLDEIFAEQEGQNLVRFNAITFHSLVFVDVTRWDTINSFTENVPPVFMTSRGDF